MSNPKLIEEGFGKDTPGTYELSNGALVHGTYTEAEAREAEVRAESGESQVPPQRQGYGLDGTYYGIHD